MMPTRFAILRQIPTPIWVLGFVSLLMDISSEMVHSLLPMFLVSSLGASATTVGVIEGVAEATALIVKVFSGVLSDYLGNRKWLAVAGYALGALSKPFFAIAPSAGLVLTARVADRIGKGLRGAPRDALVADLAPAHLLGASFGLRQSLDTIGAFAGPLLAVGLMLLWTNDFRRVFWIAVIPGTMAVLLLTLGVQEPAKQESSIRTNPISVINLRKLSPRYWRVVAIGAMFTLARFSEAFLVLRAMQCGMRLALIPLVMVAMNVVYALSAYPFGNGVCQASCRVTSNKFTSIRRMPTGGIVAAGAVRKAFLHAPRVTPWHARYRASSSSLGSNRQDHLSFQDDVA
ncbi:Permeases of the major facilitator superfamily [Janthinobacterium sp. CG23_2]|nr:Permeases of the major facilitator superfamily [Janthinobacterium sp. CG23_2]CUU27998.1 Permeases of the major facilitator superfamily [Janthinobacterium sp. CG23_2]